MKPPDDIPLPNSPPKRTMGARAKRKEENKDKDEVVVKCSLKKLLHRPELAPFILERVEATSKAVNRMSLAVNLFIKELADGVSDLRNFKVPSNFLDTKSCTMFRWFMLGTEGATKDIDDCVSDFIQRNDHILPPLPKRFQGDRNTYSKAGNAYLANFKTTLWTCFLRRQLKFFKSHNRLGGAQAAALMYMVNGWKLPPNLQNTYMHPNTDKLVAYHRQLLGLVKETDKVSETYLKRNPIITLRYTIMMLRYFEKKGLKTFNIAPICRMGATHMFIDTSVLYGIAKDAKVVDKKTNLKVFESLAKEQWESLFKVDMIASGKKKFTGTIETDGVAVSIHYRKPKASRGSDEEDENVSENKKWPKMKDLAGCRVLGLDPGRTNLAYMVERSETDEEGKTKFVSHKFTRQQYYHEAGLNALNKKKDAWNRGIKDSLAELSKNSPKGLSVSKMKRFLEVYKNEYEALWEEYMKPRWALQRFLVYGGKRRAIHSFFERIKGDDERKIVVAYGSAPIGPGGSGERSVPVKWLYREFVKRFDTYLVSEFRTTMVHYETDTLLTKVKVKTMGGKPPKGGREVRGLRWCGSTKEGKFIDRDLNAAINILRCFEAGARKRPRALDRNTAEAVPKKRESKYIRNNHGACQSRRWGIDHGRVCNA